MNKQDLLDTINTLDRDEIDVMFSALRSRSKRLQEEQDQRNALELKPKDRVRITNISPKYLAGCEGTIVRKMDRSNGKPGFMVKIDEFALSARGYAGEEIGIPAGCLEKIEGDAA